jgi:CRISPR-associated protein Csx10
MIALTYNIELREPVLVTRLEGDPNANISYDYIPGSALRAALLLRLAARHGVPPAQVVEDPRTGETARRLFFGQPCFLNAYPLARDRRAMPTPLSWRQKKKERYAKGREARIYDFLSWAPDDEQYARVSSPFCWWDSSSKASLTAPERKVMVHTQRAIQNRNRRRAVRNDGQVFQYQPLASDQTLAGAILCDAQDAQVLKELLEGDHAIGGARTAGYGRVTISKVLEQKTGWREAPGDLPDQTDTFALLLTSDLLLRDAGGQYAVGKEIWLAALQARLRHLGYGGSIRADGKAFIDVALVGGFNRKWGLPLPQAQALKMGSVIMVQADPPVPKDVLHALEQAGLGERRVDGFGRLAVICNPPEQLDVLSNEIFGSRSSQYPPVALKSDEASAGIARRMAQRLLEQRLETALLAAAARVEVHAPPNRSQLSRLRNITLNILRNPTTAREGQAGQDRFMAFLESVSQRKTTREQWDRARVHIEQSGKKQLFKDWLAAVYGADKLSEQDWREKTGLEMAKQQIGGDITVALDQAMRCRLGLRLIAEVLKRASKASAARGSA